MRGGRRILVVLAVGVAALGSGLFWDRHRSQAADDPLPRRPVQLTAAAPATTLNPTTTTMAGPPGLPQPTRPVDVPADPYAPEPLVEIGTIEIPKLGLVHRIFHGVTLRTIDHGPSHWPGTAFPGQTGNAVFAGHRVTHSRPFRNIDQLVPGDQVVFTVNGVRSMYTMTGSEIVTPDALRIVDPTPTPTATLFACHPPGSARYRYVVKLALAT